MPPVNYFLTLSSCLPTSAILMNLAGMKSSAPALWMKFLVATSFFANQPSQEPGPSSIDTFWICLNLNPIIDQSIRHSGTLPYFVRHSGIRHSGVRCSGIRHSGVRRSVANPFSQQTLTYTLPTSMLDESLLLTTSYTICTWWRVQSVQRDLAIVARTRSLWFNSQRLPAFHISMFFFRHNKDILYRIQFTFFLMFINWKMSGIVEESTSSARYEKSNLWGCRNVQTISTLMYDYGNSRNRMFTWFKTN